METRRDFLKSAGMAAATAVLPACLGMAHPRPQRRPNIVFILADDLGNHDLSCCGSELYHTPNIDKLATEAMYFNRAYASFPTCAPSRMSLLTGKYPARLGCWNHGRLGGVEDGNGNLPLEEVTYAEVFKKAGYATGHIGKWHCGEAGYMPQDQGYDYVYGTNDFCCIGSYYYPFTPPEGLLNANPRSRIDGMDDVERGKHLTKILSDNAVDFIRKNKDRPFLLDYWDYAVHAPIYADADKVEKYRDAAGQNRHQKNPGYAALVEHFDEAVGKILDAIKENGLADNTVVIFFSDNGGAVYRDMETQFNDVPITSNSPLRDGKHSQFEGGVRVPLFIKWSHITTPGTVCSERVIGHDLYPTMLAMAGLKGDSQMDGYDLTPLLKNPRRHLSRKALHWLRYPELMRYLPDTPKEKGPMGTILQGDWKLIEFQETTYGQPQSFELYNIREDISEINNLADQFPEKVESLKQAMYAWRKSVGAPIDSFEMYRKAVKSDQR